MLTTNGFANKAKILTILTLPFLAIVSVTPAQAAGGETTLPIDRNTTSMSPSIRSGGLTISTQGEPSDLRGVPGLGMIVTTSVVDGITIVSVC